MAEREMSAKELLDQLYAGLNLQPTVEAEMDARELLALASTNKVEPAERTGGATHEATGLPVVKSEPAPPGRLAEGGSNAIARGAKRVRASLILAPSIVVAGVIIAAAFHEYRPSGASTALVLTTPSRTQWSPTAAVEELEAVLLVNPFDETEVFEFPPGTSENDARDAMAALLLKRAIERRAHL